MKNYPQKIDFPQETDYHPYLQGAGYFPYSPPTPEELLYALPNPQVQPIEIKIEPIVVYEPVGRPANRLYMMSLCAVLIFVLVVVLILLPHTSSASPISYVGPDDASICPKADLPSDSVERSMILAFVAQQFNKLQKEFKITGRLAYDAYQPTYLSLCIRQVYATILAPQGVLHRVFDFTYGYNDNSKMFSWRVGSMDCPYGNPDAC